ncbi:Integral membrane protein [Staphylococcus piscifermentans]|uniref:YdcF family protein n=1 Tax=Staphylococcus piscifermentans TaxID=70258 RepID=UPI000B949D0F|nr:YdcF family protein [Staphylococcus piscifermentans]SNU99629.1 Integral membrane protein [Staphylococcus piscifermentans]
MTLFISTILSILLLCSYIYLFFNQRHGLNIISFFLSLITGFCIIIIHLLTDTFPYDLAIITLIGGLLLLYKHRAIFEWKSARMFLLRLLGLAIAIGLLACAFYLLSWLPVPILNGLFLWLCWITVSALFALVHYLSWSSAYSMIDYPKPTDLIIVLGAGLYREKVTQMLAWRLDRAVALYLAQDHPTYIVVSGGKGEGNQVSEAEAMKSYLIEQHVLPSHIIMEADSHSTYENLYNTKQILADRFSIHPRNITIISSQFHVLRALRFAQILKLKASGLGSRTPYAFFDTALIRDYLALMYCYKLLLTIYFGLLFIFSILETNPFLLKLLGVAN